MDECAWRNEEKSSVEVAVKVSREKESKAIGVGVNFSPPGEERMKRREQLINRLPLNVSVYIPGCSPSLTISESRSLSVLKFHSCEMHFLSL